MPEYFAPSVSAVPIPGLFALSPSVELLPSLSALSASTVPVFGSSVPCLFASAMPVAVPGSSSLPFPSSVC